MNQIGDKPEEVRKHHEEEKRRARKDKREPADRATEDRERDRSAGAVPDDEAYSTFDMYEEPEDRP
ncbi:hypothetical protein ACFPM3_17245 [Streptomyces coeruleoprunus]|uniref:Uncharacterized protein n=1 Tax=Streptomyces coeruleoprunus TaxID=285563 RepID=A0ABV9XFV7_9ACTN